MYRMITRNSNIPEKRKGAHGFMIEFGAANDNAKCPFYPTVLNKYGRGWGRADGAAVNCCEVEVMLWLVPWLFKWRGRCGILKAND